MKIGSQLAYPMLPSVADHAPHRMVYIGAAGDKCQVYCWDRETGATRQVTDRVLATMHAAIDPRGTGVWWFDDDLSGNGSWRISDFDRPGHCVPALRGAPAAGNGGLAMASDGTAAIGSSDQDGLTIWVRSASGEVTVAGRTPHCAHLVDMDPHRELIAVATDPEAAEAVTVLTIAGDVADVIAGGAGRGVWALGFSPHPAGSAPQLLLIVEADGAYSLATWTESEGLAQYPWCRFDTEITAGWYPDGRRSLVRQDRHGNSFLHTVDLLAGTRTPVPTPPGGILDAAAWPDGDVACVWSDATTPPSLCSLSGMSLPASAGGLRATATAARETTDPMSAVGPRHQSREIWVPGPGGPIHALLSIPAERPQPLPAVFSIHGGPFQQARNSYDPLTEILVSVGFAVVRVNYRGSGGYGAAWRNDVSAGVGLTALQDLAAVRSSLVERGLVASHRIALWGHSWGGYLTLLALGAQPDLWTMGVAITPIADYVAAFDAAAPAVRALDVALFGGTPEQVPDRYAASSPISYVDQVRGAVFIRVATDDSRCPPASVENYVRALRGRGVPVEFTRQRSGHEDFDARGQISLIQDALLFMRRHLQGVRGESTSVTLAIARPVGARPGR